MKFSDVVYSTVVLFLICFVLYQGGMIQNMQGQVIQAESLKSEFLKTSAMTGP